MAFNPDIHRRQSIRIANHNYSQPGAYFITICTHQRANLFGEIIDENIVLNDIGRIVQNCWNKIPEHFPTAFLDECVIMPNHMHGIVVINNVGANNHSPNENTRCVRANNNSPLQNGINGTSKTIGSIIRGFKIGVMYGCRNQGQIMQIWQRNYWERIIRNAHEMQLVRQYIRNNPAQWQHDGLNDM